MVSRWLQAERRTGSVHRPKTGVLPTVLRNQLPKAVYVDDVDYVEQWNNTCRELFNNGNVREK